MTTTGPKMSSLLDDAAHAAPKASPGRASVPSSHSATKDRLMLGGAVVGILLTVGILVYQFVGGPPSAAELTSRITMVDMETGEIFEGFRIRPGEGAPFKNPNTGKNTLAPAEACYWTRDGKAKLEPTHVLLNEVMGKPGPTICPDCGRKVVGRNPMPPVQLMNEALERADRGK
jgi:hypothetical protein